MSSLVASALRDDLAAVEEVVGNVDRLVEQAARVGAQVDDIAERMAAGRLVDRDQRRLGLLGDVAGEGVDVDVADAVLDLPLHRTKLDPLAGHADIDRLVAAGPDDRELHVGARIALHLRDGLVERQAVDQLAVDVRDVVAGLDAGAPGRRVLGRRDHLHRAVFDRDGEAKAAVIAVGRGLELVEVARLDIGTVRVERGEHAVDRALDQRVVVDRVDVVRLHPLVDAHELLELLVIGRVRGSEGAGGHRNQGERSDERERGKKLGRLNFMVAS